MISPAVRGAALLAAAALCGMIPAQAAESGEEEAPVPAVADSGKTADHFRSRRPRVSGYVQIHYRYAFKTGSDTLVDNDDFRVQRVRLGVDGDILPWLSYEIEVDPRAPEVTGVLRDAYLTLRVIPRHKLRIGQQKTQFGYENRESSTRLFAVNRTDVSDNLSRGVNLRDIGVGLIGNVKLGKGWRLEDAVTVVNGAGMNVQNDDTRMKDVWGRLGIRWKRRDFGDWTARLGASGGIGDHVDPGDTLSTTADDFRLKFRRLGADLEIDHEFFFLSAEYVAGWDENAKTGATEEPFGYYVNLIGKTPWKIGPVIRYDVLGDEFQRWTLGAFYGLQDEPFRVLLNYELRLKKDDLRGDDKLYVWVQAKF